MFVITDGSPNVPNTHGDDLTNPRDVAAGRERRDRRGQRRAQPVRRQGLLRLAGRPPGRPGRHQPAVLPGRRLPVGAGRHDPDRWRLVPPGRLRLVHRRAVRGHPLRAGHPGHRRRGNGTINAGTQAVVHDRTSRTSATGTAHGVTLSDPLPGRDDLDRVNPNRSTDCTITTGTLNCNFGDMAAGEEEVVTVTGTDGQRRLRPATEHGHRRGLQ